ncbi:MAG: tetratricopeptide repeat protein [Planctomycetota bacterium]
MKLHTITTSAGAATVLLFTVGCANGPASATTTPLLAAAPTPTLEPAILVQPFQDDEDDRLPMPAPDRTLDRSALDLAYFNTTEFEKRFAESFLSVTDIEPRLTEEEAEDLQEIIELIQTDKKDRAMVRLERGDSDAASALYPFLIGQLHFDAEELEEALPYYAEAIKRFSKFQRAWNNKALIHFQLGESDEAASAFSRAISLGKVDERTFGLMAVCLLNGENYISAETAFRHALMLNPARVEWKQGLARALFMQERYPEAVALFSSLLAEKPDSAEFWLLQGNALLGMGEPMRAAENFRIAEQLGGATNASLNLLADIYANEGLNDLAVQCYVGAFDLDPDATPDRALKSARMMTWRGQVVAASQLLDGIEGYFDGRLEPETNATLLKLRAKIAARNGDAAGQVAALEEIVRNNPLDGDALILLGEALASSGRLEEGLMQFDVAARIDGFEARAKVEHGRTLVRNGRYAEAVPLLKASLQVEDSASVRRYLEGVEKAAKRSGR